jgi:hypothetical protein
MKKQLHILEGIIILIVILLAGLATIKFIYDIRHEKVDTSYMFNINFENLNVNENSKAGNISFDNNNLNLDVTLENPNDFYEFTLDINNKGTLDAKIANIDLKVDNPKEILKYRLTYLNDTNIEVGDILKSNEVKTIKIHIEYPETNTKIYDALTLKLNLLIEFSTTN